MKLKICRQGSPGTVTVSIRATSGGLPTGPDLCAGTTNGNTLTTNTNGEWRRIQFTTTPTLSNGVVYAIVVRVGSASPINSIRWRLASASLSDYSNGTGL